MISFWLSAVSDDDNELPRKLLIAASKTEDSDSEGEKRDIEQTWIKNGGATKRKAKREKDSREDVMIRNIPTISTFLKVGSSTLIKSLAAPAVTVMLATRSSASQHPALLFRMNLNLTYLSISTSTTRRQRTTARLECQTPVQVPPHPPAQSPTPRENETEAGASDASVGGRDPAVTDRYPDRRRPSESASTNPP
ncbi:hypothetical protein DPEC_G00300990 [Dallia pectoralis]|uniref:Uncharacterized protein n=1 Tax=Dallia pectoralis TaxID=75939 RepID=A0ACC2FGN6_DALPE|nr:hypothetical protein DPEC_G00300990 [Dallia pectoralis]